MFAFCYIFFSNNLCHVTCKIRDPFSLNDKSEHVKQVDRSTFGSLLFLFDCNFDSAKFHVLKIVS